MDTLFLLLFLVSIPASIIGLIKPSLISRVTRLDMNRKKVAGIFGTLLVGSFIMFGFTTDPVQKAETKNSIVEQQTQQITDQSGGEFQKLLDVAPSLTPSPTSTPQPTEPNKPTGTPTPTKVAPTSTKTSPTPTPTKVAPTPTKPNPTLTPTAQSSGVVKKSNSGICHAPGTTYYDRTTNYTPYSSVQACLDSGGRLPYN